jgi:hypothetical protein
MVFLEKYAFNTSHLNTLRHFLTDHFEKRSANSEVASTAIKNRTEELSKEIEFLFVMHRKGNVSENLFTTRLKNLETELEDLNELIAVKRSENYNIKNLLSFAVKALTAPHHYWKDSPLEIRRKLQEFYFPKGIIYDGINLRTPKLCSIFKLKEYLGNDKFPIVDPRRFELLTFALQKHCSTS